MADPRHTVLVPLTQGKFAIVDFDDYELVKLFRWTTKLSDSKYDYAHRQTKTPEGKTTFITMHRQLLDVPRHIRSITKTATP